MTAGRWNPDEWTPSERLTTIVAQEINDAPAEELIRAVTDDVLRAWAAKIRTIGRAKGWSTWSADYMDPDVEFVDAGLPPLDEIDVGPGDEKDTSGDGQPAAGESTPATTESLAHETATPRHQPERNLMSNELPHDPYITAVVDALTAAGLEPTRAETRDSEINGFDTGPDAGCRTELDALLVWDGDTPGLATDVHEDGFVLLWEHPAEQWQWAPRKHHGELEHTPDFLASLPRWVDPAIVVAVVRVLLAGLPAPGTPGFLWPDHEQAQAAVDAWAAEDPSEAAPVDSGRC